MKKPILFVFAFLFCSLSSFNVNAQEGDTQTPMLVNGYVWSIEYIRTADGLTNDYLDYIAKYYIKNLEEAKRRDYIKDYKVISSIPSNESDWDIMLMVAHENYEALDNIDEKIDAWVSEREENETSTDRKARQKAIGNRFELRTVIGGRLARELVLDLAE